MTSTTSVKSIFDFGRTHKLSARVIALACVVPLSLAANASEQKSSHGSPAPVEKTSAASEHSNADSRVFGAKKPPKLAAVAAQGEKSAATSHGGTPKVSLGGSTAPKSKAGHDSLWAYTGDKGPERWGSLRSEYAACGAGKMQSPINISGGMAVAASKIKFNYKASDLTVRNNGHTVQVDYDKGSHIVVDGHRFNLLQFHFHTPSEHLIDGRKYPVEMHLVHMDAKGKLAVVGVMMEMGENNIALAEIMAHLPETASEPAHIGGVAINARDLLPQNGSYNHYKGSLTTPPCSEGVNWFVLTNPIQASAAQIRKFSSIMGENARPAQPTHNRLVISEK